MNGAPPPPPLPSQPPVQLAREGMGCFAKGCLTILIVGFLLLACGLGGTWYFYVKMVDNLTSLESADVQVQPPSEGQFQTAETSMNRLREAVAKNKETTVEFTAADLNALFARDAAFSEWRGKIRVEIANSTMTIAVSAPLHSIPLPRVRKRWFNGTARFSFTYDAGTFSFDIKSAEAGGHQVPDIFLSESTISSFNDSMNKSFRNEVRENNQGSEFWDHVKRMSLEGDKLVVTTQVE